jgi:hypothetical protein
VDVEIPTIPAFPRRGGRPKGLPKTGGRVKGKWSEQHKEARELFGHIIADPRYLESVSRRALSGKLAPAVEVRILDYVFGRPAETINANIGIAAITPANLRNLTGEQLAQALEASRAAVAIMGLLSPRNDPDNATDDTIDVPKSEDEQNP